MIYWIAYVLFKIISGTVFPCTFFGKKNLPPQGSYILASNHLSNLDPMILGISRWRRFSYLAKDSLFKNKISSFFLHQVGAFPIKRNTSDFRAVRETMKRLKHGCPVVIFPEGRRKGSGDESGNAQAEQGIGLIAVRSGVPVIPAFIFGSDKVMPPKARWIQRHPVTVKIGSPMHFSKGQSYAEISEQILREILKLEAD